MAYFISIARSIQLPVGFLKLMCTKRYASESSHLSPKEVDKVLAEGGWPYPISSSQRIKDRKSTFLAHASCLPSPILFDNFITHLTSQPELKRATHCMYAYRTNDPANPTGLPVLGQHDGNESGAGDYLARLLEVTRCQNVVVVVSRWYGGVKLGSDRWRRISETAKEALDLGGFIPPKEQHNVSKSITKKKKRRR